MNVARANSLFNFDNIQVTTQGNNDYHEEELVESRTKLIESSSSDSEV